MTQAEPLHSCCPLMSPRWIIRSAVMGVTGAARHAPGGHSGIQQTWRRRASMHPGCAGRDPFSMRSRPAFAADTIARATQIIVDDLYRGPTELPRAISEPVLPSLGFRDCAQVDWESTDGRTCTRYGQDA